MKATTTLKIVLNWNTIGQVLGPNSTDAQDEAFIRAGRKFAAANGYEFDTIRDDQISGFEIHGENGRDLDLEELVLERILSSKYFEDALALQTPELGDNVKVRATGQFGLVTEIQSTPSGDQFALTFEDGSTEVGFTEMELQR